MQLTDANREQLISELGFTTPAAFDQEWDRLSDPEREQVLALVAAPVKKTRAPRKAKPEVQPVTVTRRAPTEPKVTSPTTNPAIPVATFQSF